MGITFSSRSNESLKRSNVKLQAQQVTAFNGNAINWRSWKKKTRAAIGTAGLLSTLDSESYARRNPIDNETVFHILQVATSDGSASHLVDKFEDDKDGYGAYMALVTWYEGDELTTETAEDIRSKLDRLTLSTRTTASEYINLFQQYNKQLLDLGEEYTKSKTVNMFLVQITDPDYEGTKELCIENRLPLTECIERIRSKERRITRDKGARRRNEITTRRDRHEQENQVTLPPNMDKYITEHGYYSIPEAVWDNLTKDQMSHVKRFNLRVRRKRGRNYHDRTDREEVTVRRTNNNQTEGTTNEPDPKKLKTVQFIDNDDSRSDPQHQQPQETHPRTSRREALTFSSRNINHNTLGHE